MKKAKADAEVERRTVIRQELDEDDALDMLDDNFDTKGETKGGAVSKEKQDRNKMINCSSSCCLI